MKIDALVKSRKCIRIVIPAKAGIQNILKTPDSGCRRNDRRIGGFWSRRGDVEIDIVALDDDGGKVLFGECKLAGHKVTRADLQQLREKARQVKWLSGSRQEYFALFSAAAMPAVARADLASEGVIIHDLAHLLAQPNAVYPKPAEE